MCCAVVTFQVNFNSFIHYGSLTSPYRRFYITHASRALQSHDLLKRELTLDHRHTFLTTQGQGGPPRMSDKLNAGPPPR